MWLYNEGFKTKDRVYRCPHCGVVIDRDYNASLNLSMYKLAQFHKQENANVQDSLYPNLSLWRVILNESSYGKIGFYEEGNKQISIFLQIFGNGITNIVEIIREKFLVRQKNRHRQRPHIKMSDNKRNKIELLQIVVYKNLMGCLAMI